MVPFSLKKNFDVFIFSGCTLVEFMPLYVRMQIHKRLKGMFI